MNWGRKQQRFVFSQFWRLGSPGLFLVSPVFRCVSGCLLTVLQSRERKRSLSSSSYKTTRPIKLELKSLCSPVWVLSCSVMSDSLRLSMDFSRQEYWSGLPCHSPGDLPDPRTELEYHTLAGGFITPEPPGTPLYDLI